MDLVCRACMASSVALVDIFADQREPSLADILNECVDCQIKSDDELTKKICLSCICEAQAAFKFKRKCEESHQVLSAKLKQSIIDYESESQYEMLIVKLEPAEEQQECPSIQIEYQNECYPNKQCLEDCLPSSSSNARDEQIDIEPVRSFNKSSNNQQANIQSELLKTEDWELSEADIDLGCIKIEKEEPIRRDELSLMAAEIHKASSSSISASEEPTVSIDTESAAKKRQFQCPHCSKLFTQSSHLNNHIRTHTGERPFKCPHCPKAFSQASNLRKHICLHSGERPFKCPHCIKAFTRQTDLQYHISTHPGERIYKCPRCTRYFIESAELEEHLRYHTGERYNCEECSREFTYAWQLQRHIRSHAGTQQFTGERPHKCPLCPKAFTRASYLKTHISTHTGEKT